MPFDMAHLRCGVQCCRLLDCPSAYRPALFSACCSCWDWALLGAPWPPPLLLPYPRNPWRRPPLAAPLPSWPLQVLRALKRGEIGCVGNEVVHVHVHDAVLYAQDRIEAAIKKEHVEGV